MGFFRRKTETARGAAPARTAVGSGSGGGGESAHRNGSPSSGGSTPDDSKPTAAERIEQRRREALDKQPEQPPANDGEWFQEDWEGEAVGTGDAVAIDSDSSSDWAPQASQSSTDESDGAKAPSEDATSEPETGSLARGELKRSLASKAKKLERDEDLERVSAQDLIGPTVKRVNQVGAGDGAEESRKMKVYALANQKGGVAKTTTTLNLAVALKESGHRVLAVDLDPQGNLTMSQGIDPDTIEKSLYNVLVDKMPISEIIVEAEIDIAVASIDLAGAEIAMSTQIGRERNLQKALATVSDQYDFVCIDTPPSLGLLTINALTAADKVIVPVQCEYLSMRGLVQLQNTLEMVRENLNPDVEIEGILPTMLDSRTIHAKEAIEILEENFGDMVFKSRIKKAIKFAEAPVKGSSVLKYDPDGNAAGYYRALAEEVLTNGTT